jgi:hypothetical protein
VIFIVVFSFILSFLILPIPVYAQSTAENCLIINEINTYSSNDWVEIYNYCPESIDLTGLLIRDTSKTNKVNLSGVITSNSFLTFDFSDSLNKTGDTVRLVKVIDNQEQDLNTISYGGTNEVCAPLTIEESLGRYPDANSTVERLATSSKASSNNESSLKPCPSPTPLATATNTPTAKPILTPTPSKTPTHTVTNTPKPTNVPTMPIAAISNKLLGESSITNSMNEGLEESINSDLLAASNESTLNSSLSSIITAIISPVIQIDNKKVSSSNFIAIGIIILGLIFLVLGGAFKLLKSKKRVYTNDYVEKETELKKDI